MWDLPWLTTTVHFAHFAVLPFDAPITEADKKKDKVPKSFPGVLKLNDSFASNILGGNQNPGNQNPYEFLLHDSYRKLDSSGGVPPEFEYFYTHLLRHIDPNRTNFKKDKKRRTLSEIYTISDEAFGLLILHDRLHVWEEQHKHGQQPDRMGDIKKLEVEGRYTNSKSGRGMNKMGRMMHAFLKKCIKRRRETEASVRLESKVLGGGHDDHSLEGDPDQALYDAMEEILARDA